MPLKSYTVWRSMLKRCYYNKYNQPSYKNCFVDSIWHNYSNFKKWYDENIFDYCGTIELDKDILLPKNKKYGPDVCCLIPESLNLRIHISDKKGIRKTSLNKEIYKVVIYSDKQKYEFGPFYSHQDAINCSFKEKEKLIRAAADLYFQQGYINSRVYNCLKNWNVLERMCND